MSRIPSTYREEVMTPFFKYIKSGESFFIVGAPSVGKTRLMDFMMGDDPDAMLAELDHDSDYNRDWVKVKYLGRESASRIWLIRVDMNRMRPEKNNWGFQFFELLLNTLLLSCSRNNTLDGIDELKEELASLDARVIQSKDELMAHRLFEMAVDKICQLHKIRICFLFDEFDDTYRDMPREVFAQLRAVRDANKYRISYALFLRNLPEKILDPVNNESFYELISRNMLGVGPYSISDTLHVINQLEERHACKLNDEKRTWLRVNSGGHPGLVQALFVLLKEHPNAEKQMQNLEWYVQQDAVKEEFRKLWKGLLKDEQDALSTIAHGDKNNVSPQAGKLLVAKGLIKSSGEQGITFFTPLLGYWL